MKNFLLLFGALLAVTTVAQEGTQVGAAPTPRYATDAYPGFDTNKDLITPERKEPRWFSWWNGPNRDDAASQFAYCQELEAEEKWSKAAKQYDALVREWPTSAEAPRAQLRLAQILEEKEEDIEEAFAAYCYLIDFYSLTCDYKATAEKLYALALRLRHDGKTIIFFRFKNTVDVRRSFEAAILRAPGAEWSAQAMLTVADLREEEGRDEEAVTVYENLRNIHYGTRQAKVSLGREAAARMRILREKGYNRARLRDTISYLKLAASSCDEEDLPAIKEGLAEAEAVLEAEAYRAAAFYDSRMRTRHSAINAFERYLRDYPEGAHAEEIRARLEEMKKGEGEKK